MNIKKRLLFTTFLLAVYTFVVSSAVFPQERELPKFSARVKLSVSAEDIIKGRVISYLSRELRSLGDVEIVDENPEWELSIIAIETKSKAGYKMGVALSVVLRRCLDIKSLKNILILTGKLSAEQANFLDVFKDACYVSNHELIVSPPEDLKSICEEIIADFDSNFLEEARKRHQEILKYIPPE